MEAVALKVESRNKTGKCAARELRRQGQIPAVVYGAKQDPQSISLDPAALQHAMSTPRGRNTILKLEGDGKDQLVILKDLLRHPLKRSMLHADLFRVAPGQSITVDVPFSTSGKPVGVGKGGRLKVVVRTLPVKVAPENIPASIEADVSHLDLNSVMKVEELSLPQGVEVLMPASQTVASIQGERKKEEDEAEEGAEAAADGDKPAAEAK